MKISRLALLVWAGFLLATVKVGWCVENENGRYEEDDVVQEDPYTQHVDRLMADLHRVYSGKFENLHADFNKRFTEQERRYTELEQKYEELAQSLKHNDRNKRQGVENVAFTAQLTHDQTNMGNFQTVKYDLVTSNIGNGYNKLDGIFTAPMPGMYVFSWTSANNVHSHMQTELVVNNALKGRTWSDAMDHDDVAIGSNTIVVSLKVGDTVWVRSNNVHSAVIMGEQMSTFSGWFLF